ncbi:MAG: hypothetical protein M3332_02640 [Actinomycetota bacterium]|nr:hypothetical protein [Actinomycetota bacterium]
MGRRGDGGGFLAVRVDYGLERVRYLDMNAQAQAVKDRCHQGFGVWSAQSSFDCSSTA